MAHEYSFGYKKVLFCTLLMRPDFAFKYFGDERNAYVHLLMALAADPAC